MLNMRAKTVDCIWNCLILHCAKKKGKKRVPTNVGKDLCDWWDYENNVEKMALVSCFWRVSKYISFLILLNAFIALMWN